MQIDENLLNNSLPPEMLQEMFFDCIESLLKQKKRKENSIRPSDEIEKLKKIKAEKAVHTAMDNAIQQRSINDIINIKKNFDKMLDVEKVNVLTKFIENKAVLTNLYDLMF